MNFKSMVGATCACLAVVSFNADAALEPRLGGLAYYDTEADLTWLTDANASAGSVYDTFLPGSGRMSWFDAYAWVGGLNVAGVTGWRLPDSDTSCYGYDCIGSEFGNLFNNVLGNSSNNITNTGPFNNVQPLYWSATDWVGLPSFHQTLSNLEK